MSLSIASRRIYYMTFAGTEVSSSQVLPFYPFQRWVLLGNKNVSLYPASWDFPCLPWLLKYHGELATISSTSFKSLGCTALCPIDLSTFRFLRWPWTWFLLTVGDFALPVPMMLSSTWDVWKERVPLKIEITWKVPQPSLHLFLPVHQHCLSEYIPLTFFFWLPYMYFLLPFAFHCKVQFQFCICLTHTFPTEFCLLFQGYLSWFPLPILLAL